MKITPLFAAAALVLAMAGCATQATPAPATSTAAETPTPDEAQRQDLLLQMGPLAPQEEQERIIDKARYVCGGILRGDADEVSLKLATIHFGRTSDPVTPDEASQILAIIKANGFCHA